MTIAVGSLVYIRTLVGNEDVLCAIITEGRPEFIGAPGLHYYYTVYSFSDGITFIAFDYEMVLVGTEDYNSTDE